MGLTRNYDTRDSDIGIFLIADAGILSMQPTTPQQRGEAVATDALGWGPL